MSPPASGGDRGSISGPGRSPHAPRVTKPMRHNHTACAAESGSYRDGTHTPQLPKPMLLSQRNHHNQRVVPAGPNQRPAQPKANENNFFEKMQL